METKGIYNELNLLRVRNASRQHTMSQGIQSSISTPSVEFIFSVCNYYKLNPQTRYLAIELLLHYKLSHEVKDLQLISLTCIFLSAKLHDKSLIDISKLLEASEFRYSRQELLRSEKLILTNMGYKIFLPTRYDILLLYLDRIYKNMNIELQVDIYYTASGVLDMVYLSEKFVYEYDRELVIAGVIQATLVLLTKYLGNFPQSYVLKELSEIHIQDILNTSYEILEMILGKELFSLYNFK